MKNNALQLFSLTALLLLTCSFKQSPSTTATLSPGMETAVDADFGGAFLLFAGKFGGEITKNEIVTASKSDLQVDGCARGSRIFEYTIYITKGGQTSKLSNKSNTLTGEIKDKLKALSKGDTFEFKDSKAYLPDGKEVVNVHGKQFKVV
ncbi:MAG: hypothetical protein IT262_01270 [Saprospiraceae bacterium]|nr:hypothetical protein [Saprospiraceae bacterium]